MVYGLYANQLNNTFYSLSGLSSILSRLLILLGLFVFVSHFLFKESPPNPMIRRIRGSACVLAVLLWFGIAYEFFFPPVGVPKVVLNGGLPDALILLLILIASMAHAVTGPNIILAIGQLFDPISKNPHTSFQVGLSVLYVVSWVFAFFLTFKINGFLGESVSWLIEKAESAVLRKTDPTHPYPRHWFSVGANKPEMTEASTKDDWGGN